MKKVKYPKWSVEHGLSAIKTNLLRYLAERPGEPSKIFHVLLPHTVLQIRLLIHEGQTPPGPYREVGPVREYPKLALVLYALNDLCGILKRFPLNLQNNLQFHH